MSPTSSYTLPLVPAAVLLGVCTFLIFVPVLALAALIVVAVAALGTIAAVVAALLTSAYRRLRFLSVRHPPKQSGLAGQASVLADANGDRLREPRLVHLPLDTKGVQ